MRRALLRWGLVVAVLVAGGIARVGAAQERPSALEQATHVLEHQVALAGSKDFYLILDPSRSLLTLYLKGALLQEYRVQALEVGRRRWAFVARPDETAWSGVVWKAGTLEPERLVPRLEIGPGAEPTAPPPLPEEHIVVPAVYRIRFEDGLAVEVRADRAQPAGGISGFAQTVSQWWGDFREVVWGAEAQRVRLRLTLSETDADSLYRALPPGTALLIVPPGVELSRASGAKPARSRS